jgi:hypothetical protein
VSWPRPVSLQFWDAPIPREGHSAWRLPFGMQIMVISERGRAEPSEGFSLGFFPHRKRESMVLFLSWEATGLKNEHRKTDLDYNISIFILLSFPLWEYTMAFPKELCRTVLTCPKLASAMTRIPFLWNIYLCLEYYILSNHQPEFIESFPKCRYPDSSFCQWVESRRRVRANIMEKKNKNRKQENTIPHWGTEP